MSEFDAAKGFNGAVALKESFMLPDGRWIQVVVGRVRILQDEVIAGFKTRGTESNWVARVEGATGAVNILGCQVRAITEDQVWNGPIGPNTYMVP